MADLIERQAALDAISCNITVTGRQNAELVAQTIGRFADRIKALPSIQPEIIHCNACKYWKQTCGEMKGFGLGECNSFGIKFVTCDGFCYWAERREE